MVSAIVLQSKRLDLARLFLRQSRHFIAVVHLPQIMRCLEMLSQEEIWWRPNAASNSVGNLVLHLEGNVRQWIISGLGDEPDRRERDQEFAERGPIRGSDLVARLRTTLTEACRVLQKLSPEALSRNYRIQGYKVSGLGAIADVVEHFSYHTGQIVYVTKLKRESDLRFTRLPSDTVKKSRA